MVLVVQVEDKVRVRKVLSAEGVNAETRKDLLLTDPMKPMRDMVLRYFIDGGSCES